MSVSDTQPSPVRSTYRHGDLRRALVDAGVALAREGRPGAVVLREVTRRAGVVPNAAYRHFRNHQALFLAVQAVALGELARAMEREWAKTLRIDNSAERARAQLRAVGIGYLEFAQTETGLFRTAFPVSGTEPLEPDEAAHRGQLGLSPFGLLGAALDAMVQAGVLAAAKRPQAEYLAWSAVHGMALLSIDGPLRHAPRAARQALGERVVRMVEDGL